MGPGKNGEKAWQGPGGLEGPGTGHVELPGQPCIVASNSRRPPGVFLCDFATCSQLLFSDNVYLLLRGALVSPAVPYQD